MKKLLMVMIAVYGIGMVHANGQNIIIQQNNNTRNQQGVNTTTPPPRPKTSLGIGIMELKNDGWVTIPYDFTAYHEIRALFIKPTGQNYYEQTNYCEQLHRESTNLPLDEGIYDIKIYYRPNRRSEEVSQIEAKRIMIKKDYLTRVVFGMGTIKVDIPKPL